MKYLETIVDTFKIVDPLGQTILFFIFAHGFESGTKYRSILFAIIIWQLVSSLFHLFAKIKTRLKTERRTTFFLLILLAIGVQFFSKDLFGSFLSFNDSDGTTLIPLNEVSFLFVATGITFWYFTICAREAHRLFKKRFL